MALKDPIAVYTAESNAIAYLAKQYLESAGINAFVSEDNSPVGIGPFGNVVGIHQPQIFVEKSDAEKSWRLLKEFDLKKQESKADLKSQEPKTIEALCEECGQTSFFAGSLEGTVQQCAHCDEFVDVGETDWPQEEESDEDTEKSNRPIPSAELMGEERTGWVGVPIILSHEEFLAIEEHFIRLGIDYQSKTIESRSGYISAELLHSFLVPEAHATASAIVIRNVLDIEDPATQQPFQGECPACGEHVTGAWECSSCEINFRGEFKESDEIIEFLRRYGGFEET